MATQFDLDNERAIVVAALRDSELRRMAIGSVCPEDFLGERFRVIFRAIRESHRKGWEPDADAIAVHSAGEDYGGLDYLHRLFQLDTPKNLEFHLRQLKRDAARYKVRKSDLPELDRMLSDKTISHAECMQRLSEIHASLRVGMGQITSASETWSHDLDLRCSGEVRFQSCGYSEIDRELIDGYSRGQVSVVAARTGNGKTTVVADTVRRLLSQDQKPRICVLPLEIGPVRFMDKIITSATMMPAIKLRKEAENLTLKERDELKQVAKKMAGQDDRLVVLDNPFFSLKDWNNRTAINKLEGIAAEGDFDIIVMDLFQRCLTDLRPAEIEQALVRVQQLAQQYQTHFCLVHQISRRAEERKGKRPELGDLKGSGGYEEIPDLIVLLHRPKTYKQFRRKDELELHIAKQRDYSNNLTFIGDFYPMVSRIENIRVAETVGGPENNGEDEEAEF